MKEVYFTREDIAGLAKELSALSLTDKQRKLLQAIFAAAADRAMATAKPDLVMLPAPQIRSQPGGAGSQGNLPALMRQLLNAYLPGNDFNDIISTSATGKVTEGPGSGSGSGTGSVGNP